MKKITLICLAALVTAFAMTGCKGKSTKTTTESKDSVKAETTSDSTIYGVCGDGTSMNVVQLVTDAGDSIEFELPQTDDGTEAVLGGLLAGDRLAVIAGGTMDGMRVAKKVINLTTLQGKWTSLDKNFEILEGGTVKSNVQAEKNPWTSWKIVNGELVLNTDTFSIDRLGGDSLYLENRQGIFVYTRQK